MSAMWDSGAQSVADLARGSEIAADALAAVVVVVAVAADELARDVIVGVPEFVSGVYVY